MKYFEKKQHFYIPDFNQDFPNKQMNRDTH